MENNNSEKHAQKLYVCFVCAQEFPDYEWYRRHIIDHHEENKNYLICPQCEAPIRDLKSHWRVKHKHFKLPELERYRVDTFYEWDYKYKKMKRKRPKWKEGFFKSNKMGKKIHYRSSWERDVMICMEKCIDIVEYYGDDYLSIPYSKYGRQHRYWPDFTVKMKNSETYILEIKPQEQTEWEVNQIKWKAANSYCKIRGWSFQVWTQKYIKKVKTRAVRHDELLAEHVIPKPEEIQIENLND